MKSPDELFGASSEEIFGVSTEEAYKKFLEEPEKPDTARDKENKKLRESYVLLPQTKTYALGVQALREAYSKTKESVHPLFTRDDGSKTVRPLTFKENIECRVNDYETLKDSKGDEKSKEDRLKLFKVWLDSCTGLAYKAKTNKFKIQPVCEKLITIKPDSKQAFLDVDYNSFKGLELDSSKGLYNELLTKREVVNHEGWNAALQGDTKLLKAYADIIFKEKDSPNMMGFWTRKQTDQDELRGLFVGNLDCNSNSFGYYYLSNVGSFLLVVHAQKNKGEVRI